MLKESDNKAKKELINLLQGMVTSNHKFLDSLDEIPIKANNVLIKPEDDRNYQKTILMFHSFDENEPIQITKQKRNSIKKQPKWGGNDKRSF